MNELEWRGAVARTVDKSTGNKFNWSVVPERVMRDGFNDKRPVEAFARELVATYGGHHAAGGMNQDVEAEAKG